MPDVHRSYNEQDRGAFRVGMNVRRPLDVWTEKKTGAVTREDLDIYIRRKLKDTVIYAAENSVFYSKMLNMEIAHADTDNKDGFIEAFRKIPFTYPADLRERPLDMLCVGPEMISRIVTLDTGGSTGKPKRIYFTQEDQQLTVDYFENGMKLLADSSDNVLILMPAAVPGSIGKLLARGISGFGAGAVEYGVPGKEPEECEKLLQIMEFQGITSVVALPTHMKLIAETALKNRRRYRDIKLKSVLLSAEYVPQTTVSVIQEAFGCRVYEHYGMTEMGLGCAVSCGFGEGYHLREPDLYIEIIDPATGRVIEDEQPGEIVFTTLTRKGMPFIRYRTGDISHWLNGECVCGSILKRIAKVGARGEIKGYLR